MAHSHSVKHLDPESVIFSLYQPDEIREMSVVKVSVPISFNALGLPMSGGLYDPAMGPLGDRGEICSSCKRPFFACPGHFGHIELPLPVFNPFFVKTIFLILRLACLRCHRFQLPAQLRYLLIAQMQLLDAGLVVEAQELLGKFSFISNSSDKDSEDAKEAFFRENVEEHIAKVLGESKTTNLSPDEYKNCEVLRNQYLALAKDQFRPSPTCWSCKQSITKISLLQNKLMASAPLVDTELEKILSRSLHFVTPEEVRHHLRVLWSNSSDFILALAPILKKVNLEYPTDIFFVEIVPVPPPKVRPVNFIRGKMNEHPQSLVFQQVLEHSIVTRQAAHMVKGGEVGELSEEGQQLYETMQGGSAVEKLHNAWQGLQAAVDHLVDAELNNNMKGTIAAAGLKQVISKKEGLIRMHMMGKRVNFAARTVITPDPNLGVDEIGIPEAFAKVLTYPTPVTPLNVDDLRLAVLNGPDVYPGATVVQTEDGSKIRVSENETQRASLAKRLLTPTDASGKHPVCPKIVHRHLRNGDVLLLNRQPTLHRPSIMAHRAHVLHGEKTFRLHYANCKSYNADFDGDEMNAHFPQSELARAEAYFLAQVGHQYLVPKDGTPLSGLIQDHVVSGVRLTIRGRFFDRADYCLLLQQALPMLAGHLRILPPAMLKPCCLWSGKQLVSTIILNCIPAGRPPPTLCDTSKIPSRAWGSPDAAHPWRAGGTPLDKNALSEAEVILRDGELLCGVLDKKHFGSTPYGLAHCVHELYGADACMKLLSALGRLFTAFLQHEGFTLGVRDILVTPKADAKRHEMLEDITRIGPAAVSAAFDLKITAESATSSKQKETHLPAGAEFHLSRIAAGDQMLRAALDRSYKQLLDPATNAVSRTCMPAGLVEAFPNNNLQLMVQSGAKGSTVNTLQISCLLGQIELEGRRPPLMPSGKALPSFCRFDCSPRAGGFVAGRFLTGIQPQEFFFHCMAGREGLIDTAVKTSRSGYLQRCLVKHLEGLVVSYDGTVRDSDGSVVQFAYGEDGLDVLKSRFLTQKQLPILADNFKAFFVEDDLLMLETNSSDPEIERAKKEVRHWNRKRRRSGILRPLRVEGVFPRTPDPVASRVPPSASFDTITEHLENLINSYMKSRALTSKNENVHSALLIKGVRARIDAGEPVGMLAAQSIGEPSTQMTLNTFHFAGRGEMNMTLGIPRLRELLMMASRNPKTPAMEVPIRNDVPQATNAADSLRRRLQRCCLSEILQDVNIQEWLEVCKGNRKRFYRIHMQFLPSKSLRREYSVSPHQALHHVETKFLGQLMAAMRRQLSSTSKLLDADALEAEAEKKAGVRNASENIEDEVMVKTRGNKTLQLGDDDISSDEDGIGGEDEDATLAQQRARHNETHEYDHSEESEDEQNNNGEYQLMEETNEENGLPSEENFEEVEGMKLGQQQPVKNIMSSKRVEGVLKRYKLVDSYSYDEQHERWCVAVLGLPLSFSRVDFSSLLREVAEQSVVCETSGLKRAFVNTNTDGTLLLRTDGSNLSALFPYEDLLDINRIYSNDINAMAQTYGIEAARAVLVREVRDVFKAYGITVDPRHLLLVADYMTFLGTYEPLSKRGMVSGCSPLQQMSFESSLSFLQTATLNGRRDTLQSPSSRIMLGRPCNVGTGAFSLYQQLAVSG